LPAASSHASPASTFPSPQNETAPEEDEVEVLVEDASVEDTSVEGASVEDASL
jgi:hypothetical protein